MKTPPKKETKKQSKVVEHGLTASKIESISTKNSDNFKLELTTIQKPVVNLHRQNDIMILTG